MTKAEARKLLPRVGDRRMERKLMSGAGVYQCELAACRVAYVNPRHLYYMVQFANGVRECFKVPALGGTDD